VSEIITQRIAQQLKAMRKQQGWSLDRTAQATGVSKAMLGQIERQESSPTIATLWKIATGLSCSLSSLMGAVHTSLKASEYAHDPNMRVKTLFPYNPVTGFEVFEITLNAEHEQMSAAHSAGVCEHIYVTSGNLEVFYHDSWHPVKKGEPCQFDANQAHGYRALADNAVFIDIIHYL
jgi:transcriptional regulator with XRE-family HTH domain